MSNRFNEKILGAALVLSGVSLGLDLILGATSGLNSLSALWPWLAGTLGLCGLLLLRARLHRLADEEQRDTAADTTVSSSDSLFDQEGTEPFSMARSAEQFERWVVPVIAPLLAIFQGLLAWRLLRTPVALNPPTSLLLTAAFLFGQAFVVFLFNRYVLGLSRAKEHRILRGAGLYLGLSCMASLAVAAAALAVHMGAPAADQLVLQILGWALAALALENVLNSIGSIYRPRKGGKAAAYESKLAGLLTDPASWASNMAQALDYQFGFEVSNTWLYRFLQGALAPLLLFQLAVLYALSCLVFLGPDEEGILERFGRPVDHGQQEGHLGPGFHLKYPWPFEMVRRFPARRILNTYVGYETDHPQDQLTYMLWTRPHFLSEDNFLVANREVDLGEQASQTTVPVNVLAINMPIEYHITNVYDYAYNYAEPDRVLRQIAYRSVTRETVSHGLFDLLGEGQLETSQVLQKRIQDEVAKMGLGLEVTFVGFQGVHPPVALADAFESVISADEERDALILKAQAYANALLPKADAEAAERVFTAEGYKKRRIAVAEAEAYQFDTRAAAHSEFPSVFRNDTYLRTLREALKDTQLYIVSSESSNEVIRINLEEKIRPDLFDLGPSEPGGASL